MTLADQRPEPALAAVGGPLGRHASARARSWLAAVAPLMAVSTAWVAAGVAQRGHCLVNGWNGSDQFWRGCFSDLPALYRIGNLEAGLPGYLSTGADAAYTDHPPLTGAVMALVGGLVPDGGVLAQTRWYFALWAVLAAVLVAATVFFTAASRPRHVGDVALLAASPLLLLTPLLSADVLGVALASAGIWAWARRRPLLAGVLLGLAVTARTYPLLILLALVLLGVRTGRLAPVRRALAGAAAAVALVAVPFLVANPEALTRAYAAWWRSAAGLGSPWMLPQLLGHPLPTGAVTLLAVTGIVAAVVSGTLVALGTNRRPTLAEVVLVAVAIALVTGKSFPVQASLWLLPLAALAGVRWRDHLVWVGAEALHFVAVWLYLGGQSKPDRGLPPEWYAVFVVLRVAAVLYLVWLVWRAASRRPAYEAAETDASETDAAETDAAETDASEAADGAPVSAAVGPGPDEPSDAVLDELAGEFSEAPDRLIVRLG